MKSGERVYEGARLMVGEVDLPVPHPELLREITKLQTAEEHRGCGHANWLLSLVCAEADRESTVLMLHPKPFGDAPAGTEALKVWYERHGFVVGQDEPAIMIRAPKVQPCH